MEILTNKSDSFYACYYFKRIGMFISSSDWIILKKLNEIHFYNISDEHICHGKIIRKKRKIDITSNHLIFDPDEL